MGCSHSEEKLKEEEKVYKNAEMELLLHNYDAKYIDYVFRKYSYKGVVNDKQWGLIVDKLGLGLGRFIVDNRIRDFYEKFKNGKGYSLQKLLVLAIFLGKGKSEVKSELLFEVFDVSKVLVYKLFVGRNVSSGGAIVIV